MPSSRAPRRGGGSAGRAQRGHARRTRRCACTPRTGATTRNGSTPMSMSLVKLERASLVCTVESTRWPVRAERIAISAVSRSRISPIMMTSGSWRRIARRARAKVVTDLGVGLDLGDARHLVLDRVLHGDDLLDAVVDLLKARARVVDLPEPVGPGDEHDAVVGVEPAPEEAEVVPLHAEVAEGEVVALLREQPQHDGLAERAGHRRDPDVHLAARDARRDPAVLGEGGRSRAMSIPEMSLMREATAGKRSTGWVSPRVEDPVHPHPDRELLFGGLDVDVGGARVDGLREKVVHELDDGRLLRQSPGAGGRCRPSRGPRFARSLRTKVEEPVESGGWRRGRTPPARGGRSR